MWHMVEYISLCSTVAQSKCLKIALSLISNRLFYIAVVDEKRSCAVIVSEIPSHIIGSSGVQNICGTKSQPWTVEVPIGQKVGIGILDFTFSHSGLGHLEHCDNSRKGHGVIIDKVGKRNSSICFDEAMKGEKMFVSTGNAVDIILFPSNQQKEFGQFLLSLQGPNKAIANRYKFLISLLFI